MAYVDMVASKQKISANVIFIITNNNTILIKGFLLLTFQILNLNFYLLPNS